MSAKKASVAGEKESKKYKLDDELPTSAAALMNSIQKSFPQFVKVRFGREFIEALYS